jgi:hypothetical protein
LREESLEIGRSIANLEADFADVDCHCDLPLGVRDEAYGGETARDRGMGFDMVVETAAAEHDHVIDAFTNFDREVGERLGAGDVLGG